MRVLLIEDEVDLARGLRRALESEGYAVDAAYGGEDGLYQAQSVEYDAIILDLMLPGIDGWTILRRLRQRESAPVLIITALDGVDDRVRGLEEGGDDYLPKPFELEELLSRLRALIRRSKGHPAPVVSLGDIEIETNSHSVRKGGRRVSLTPKEYALLELLALHRDRLITRTMIYDHIYDDEGDTCSNVVDVFIASLRKKLGPGIVRTRRGEGYMVGI